MTIKTRFTIQCPWCDRRKSVAICEAVPVNKVDCVRCGAVAEVHFIRNISVGKTWSVEWSR